MYANVRNNNIIDFNSKYIDEDITRIDTTEEMYLAWLDDHSKVIFQDNQVVLNPNYENEKMCEEEQRVNNLTMTALDFIGILRGFGLTLEEINTYLENNLEVKMQLTYCQNVYCGVVKQLMPVEIGGITITADMVEEAFKIKNGDRQVNNLEL